MRRLTLMSGLYLSLGVGCTCGGPTNARDLYISEVSALCNFYARCGYIGRSEEQQCNTDSVSYYDEYQTAQSAYDVSAAIQAGRLSIDPGAANQCVQGIRSASCSGSGGVLLAVVSSCTSPYRGGVPLGGTCQSTWECANGSCQMTTGGNVCSGVCVNLAATGASCTTARCDTTKDYCDSSMICRPRGVEGAACTGSGLGYSGGVFQEECQPGLGCTDNHVCARPGGPGQSCAGGACVAGYHCVSTSSASSVCAANSAHGQSCSDAQACPDGDTCVGLKLSASGICTRVLDLADSCDPMASACPMDAPCDATARRCAPVGVPLGGSCSATTPCKNSLGSLGSVSFTAYCDSTTQVCTKKLKPGDACTLPTSGSFNDPCITSCSSTTHTCNAPTPYCF